jgi:hypothetical protein
MRLDLVLTPRRAIVAATEDDAELIKLLRPGDLLPVDIKKARNGAHHRKLRALIAFVADNHPQLSTRADVERYLKFRTGHCAEFVTASGKVLLEMKSTSYRDMDELAFSAWSKAAREVVFSELFPQMNRRDIERQIEEWLSWN